MRASKPARQNADYEALNSEDKSLVDYVHGHVTDPKGKALRGQHAGACFYEYARQSKTLCALAVAFQQRDHQLDVLKDREIIENVLGRLDEMAFWYQCLWFGPQADFPHLPWRDIPLVARPYMPEKVSPLPTLRMVELAEYGEKAREANDVALREYLRRSKEKMTTDEAAKINEEYGTPPRAVWRLEESREIVAAFKMDANMSISRLTAGFKKWLELPENAKLLASGRTMANKVSAGAADRLKDLAIWKLHERNDGGHEAVREFLLRHQKRDARGKPIRFLDEKQGRGKAPRPARESMENRSQSYFLDAVARAKKHFRSLFHFEGWREREKEMSVGAAYPETNTPTRIYPSHLK